MEMEKHKGHDCIDDYKIIKSIGSGYSAESALPYTESSWRWTPSDAPSPSRSIGRKSFHRTCCRTKSK